MLTGIFLLFQKSFENPLVDNCVDNVQNCGLSRACAHRPHSYPQGKCGLVFAGKIHNDWLTEQTS